MKDIFNKKFFLGLICLIFLVLLFGVVDVRGAEYCTQDSDCGAYCATPGVPGSLGWLVNTNETSLSPVWGIAPSPDYFHLTGATDVDTTEQHYHHTGLNPGTSYSYQVKSCETGCSLCNIDITQCYDSSDVCSSYSSSWSKTTDFYEPTSLNASCSLVGNDAQASLSWTDNSSAESGYKVEMKYSNESTFNEIATKSANSSSHTESGLSQGRTVQFRVRAYHNSGSYSDYTSTASCDTSIAAPSGLSATASASCGTINLSWTDNSYGEQGFAIERKLSTEEAYTQIGTASAGATSYSDTTAAQGRTYNYKIRAYYGSVYSSYSSAATATSCLTAPSGFSCSTYNNTQINSSWSDNSTGESGFKLERSPSGCASFAQVATTSANVISYEEAGLSENTTYCYRVRAYTSDTNSSYSGTASCTTQGPPTVAPSGLTATAYSESQINLAWTDNSSNETSFRIRRTTGSSCSSSSTIITTLDANSVSYSNVGLTSGVQYCYVVCAYNSFGELCSSSQTATTILGAPTSLTAVSGSGNSINLSWTDNSSNETGFKIERATGSCGASFAQIATAVAGATTYTDSSGSNGTTYCYQVRAYTSDANSSYSNTASATTKNPPTAPSGLSASVISASQINLSWTDNSSNETGFRIRGATGSTCNSGSGEIATVSAGVVSYSNTGLTEGTQYCYVVCAYNADGDSCSSSATATTSIPVPSDVSYSSIGANSIVIGWTDNSTNETGFKIERATGSCASGFSQIGTVSAGVISYSDSLACSGSSYSSYCYRVRAYNTDADSNYATTSALKATLPCTPTNLSASIASSSQINLSWTDIAGNESGYKVEQKLGSGGEYAQVGTTAADAGSYNATGLSDGSVYYFKIRPYNSDGNSYYTSEIFATTTLPTPTSFGCSVESSSEIGLSWTDNSSNETGFKIERGTSSPPSTEVATVGQVTSYNDTNLTESVLYYYRIRAYNGSIYSDYSDICSTTTLTYVPHGYFESSIFDTGVEDGASFNYIMWQGTLPSSSHVRFQLATSNATSTWSYIGPDGTSTTYYEPSGPNVAATIKAKYHNNHRYFRYKVFLYPTTDNTQSPTVSDVIIGYSP